MRPHYSWTAGKSVWVLQRKYLIIMATIIIVNIIIIIVVVVVAVVIIILFIIGFTIISTIFIHHNGSIRYLIIRHFLSYWGYFGGKMRNLERWSSHNFLWWARSQTVTNTWRSYTCVRGLARKTDRDFFSNHGRGKQASLCDMNSKLARFRQCERLSQQRSRDSTCFLLLWGKQSWKVRYEYLLCKKRVSNKTDMARQANSL